MLHLLGIFVRVVILNPMAMAGVGAGLYIMFNYGAQNLMFLAKSPYVYGAIWLFSLLYALLFKHVYYVDSNKINWWATIKSSFSHMFTILFATACTCMIVFAANYGFGEKLDKYLRHE